VYCNQRASTSARVGRPERKEGLASIHERITGLAFEARHQEVPGELAFYGGTFTALPWDWIRAIFDGVLPFIEEGLFSGIRFSTRPDAMSPPLCERLARYPVRTVELGVQSLSDDVLRRSRRGYTAETVAGATRLARERGWNLGLQLMLGLPGDSRQGFLDSVSGAMALAPDFVRIYPTIVLRDTLLAQWLAAGDYQPVGLDEAVQWCAVAYERFLRAGIPVIRMGLHADPALLKPGAIVGGPFHPAFGYLVKVRWWRNRVDAWCLEQSRSTKGGLLVLRVAQEVVSEVLGPARENVSHWQNLWRFEGVVIEPMAGRPRGRLEISTHSGNESGAPCEILERADEVEAHGSR
jgi:histone acetyltransferase (RNA polymerase elongator complex component)